MNESHLKCGLRFALQMSMKNIGWFFRIVFASVIFSHVVTLSPDAYSAPFCIDLFESHGANTPPHTILPDGTILTVIRPSTVKSYANLDRSISAYENFQHSIYKNRLPKFRTPTTVGPSVSRSKPAHNYRSRSIFILNTSGMVQAAQPIFRGGIRIVLARRAEDALPFEDDVGLQRQRREVSAAEVGRFTVEETPSADSLKGVERSVALIRAALVEIMGYRDVEYIYVHTSRTHVRLYKMMGLIPLEVLGEDPLNKIMVFNREQLLNYLKPQALKELTVAAAG